MTADLHNPEVEQYVIVRLAVIPDRTAEHEHHIVTGRCRTWAEMVVRVD